MGHYYYITDSEYEEAKKNGIKPSVVDNRVRQLGWSIEKAITIPVREKRSLKGLKEKAMKNGIPIKTLLGRIRRGWDPEKAAAEPSLGEGEIGKRLSDGHRKYPVEILNMARENDIKYCTFFRRVNSLGWDLEKAATTPVRGEKVGI